MYPQRVRVEARARLASGRSLSEVSRELAISRATLRAWRDAGPEPRGPAPRYFALRVSCDAAWPGVVADVVAAVRGVRSRANVFEVSAPGAVVVTANWKHWPCLFPQHGPGRKPWVEEGAQRLSRNHERSIVLEGWQSAIVTAYPAEFLRGLFHSDGSRVKNWASRVVAGQKRRYEYPRWQFVNNSADIRGLCCAALDLVDVRWRQSSWKTISVSRRADVARLDALIGVKR